MAIWPFGRKNRESVNPDEVQEYYKTKKSERVGMTWLLAGVTMIITAVLAVALFFGGRWLYRTIFDNDESEPTTQQETTEEASNSDEASKDDSTSQSDPETVPGDDNSISDENVSTDNQTETESGSSSDASSETPQTGASEELPDTGPGPGGLQ